MDFQSVVEIDGPKMAWVEVWDDKQRQLLYYKIRYSGKDVIKLASQLSRSIMEMKQKLVEKTQSSGAPSVIIWRTWPAITTVTNEDGHPVAFIASFRAGTIPELDEQEWAVIGSAKDEYGTSVKVADDQINDRNDQNQRITMPTPLQVNYDPSTDVLTIDGFQYAGQTFRNFANPDADKLYRLVHTTGNTITLVGIPGESEAKQRGREWNESFDEASSTHGD